MDVIESICGKNDPNNGEKYLIKFVKYCAVCFQTQVYFIFQFIKIKINKINLKTDPRTNKPLNLIHKEGLLWAFGIMKSEILGNEMLSQNIEEILGNYVLPELNNSIGFLRARACWVFGRYGHIGIFIFQLKFS